MSIPLVGNTAVTNQILAQQQYATPDKDAAEMKASSDAQVQTAATETKETAKPEKQGFLEQLQLKTQPKEAEKPTAESLRNRLADIRKQSAGLRQFPLPKAVKTYISDVKDFLSDLNEHAYAANKDGDYFQNIEVVDHKLDEMVDALLQEEQDGLDLAASLGELEGLLIDIYV